MSKKVTLAGMDRDERAEWVPVLIQARKAWNLTQAELAERAGVSMKSVGNLERGDVVPQAGTFEKVREALELPDSLTGAEFEVAERERRLYEAASERANARISAREMRLSLRTFSNGQLLRELLHRAEDPDYAHELDDEAERQYHYELALALDEDVVPPAIAIGGSYQSGTRIVVSDPDDELSAVADDGGLEGPGEDSI